MSYVWERVSAFVNVTVPRRILERVADWTFLTNHAQVLLRVATDPASRFGEIGDGVGITERAAQRVVADLVEAGHRRLIWYIRSIIGRLRPAA